MTQNAFRLDSKVAVITGGASGIGLAIAKRFAQHGAAVELIDIQSEVLVAALSELRASGYVASGELCDIGDPAAVKEAFKKIVQRHGRIDILVNNAGIAHVGNALTTSSEDFSRVQRVNVLGVAHCTQAALESMLAQRSGVILNIASTVAQFGLADRFAYTASKGAVLAMTYSIAILLITGYVAMRYCLAGFTLRLSIVSSRRIMSVVKRRCLRNFRRLSRLVGWVLRTKLPLPRNFCVATKRVLLPVPAIPSTAVFSPSDNEHSRGPLRGPTLRLQTLQ
jgi:NAD(P)-dependent dehydrogenase (short-subunit alcohol dehydrogenase family)